LTWDNKKGKGERRKVEGRRQKKQKVLRFCSGAVNHRTDDKGLTG